MQVLDLTRDPRVPSWLRGYLVTVAVRARAAQLRGNTKRLVELEKHAIALTKIAAPYLAKTPMKVIQLNENSGGVEKIDTSFGQVGNLGTGALNTVEIDQAPTPYSEPVAPPTPQQPTPQQPSQQPIPQQPSAPYAPEVAQSEPAVETGPPSQDVVDAAEEEAYREFDRVVPQWGSARTPAPSGATSKLLGVYGLAIAGLGVVSYLIYRRM